MVADRDHRITLSIWEPTVYGDVHSKELKLSETVTDMVAYTKVNDSLFLKILHSTEPELQEARKILENVERRRLYRFIGQTNPKAGREDVAVTALELRCFIITCRTVYNKSVDFCVRR